MPRLTGPVYARTNEASNVSSLPRYIRDLMYVPKQFQENRIDRLAEAMRDIELATPVTSSADWYYTSHIPMIFKQSSEGMFLEGHVARANDHWTVLKEPRPSIAIFMGPQAYIVGRAKDRNLGEHGLGFELFN